jgi:predicted PurR-regulated permease PerM
MNSPQLQRGVFLALLAAVTAAFVWVLLPFFGAVLWGVALAILFTPLYKWLLRKMPGKPNAAALSTLAICLFIVILPLAMVGVSLVQEIALVTQNIRSGQINFAAYFQQILNAIAAVAAQPGRALQPRRHGRPGKPASRPPPGQAQPAHREPGARHRPEHLRFRRSASS